MNDKKAAGIDPELVRELAKIIGESGLSEIEVEHGELRLRLARTLAPAPAAAPAAYAVPVAAPQSAASPAAHAAPEPPARAAAHPGMVPSPMVGTAYLSPEPGAPTFIKLGDTVSEGQTMLVVEAMKTFNPIPAPRAGKVTAIMVADGQPVEYGEPLAVIE